MCHKHFLRILPILLSILLVAGTGTVFACSCGPTPNVLEAFEHAGNVVILKALSVENIAASSTLKYVPVDGVISTRMVVEKVFKGKLKVGDEINFAQGGGADCIWTFNEESVGQRYLFYLVEGDRSKGLWFGGGCGRSTNLDRAHEDLLYLNNLSKVKGKTRISGAVEFEEYKELAGSPIVEGIKIKIIGQGKKAVTVRTDKNGVYEVYDLPPGRYQLIPEVPKGWQVNQFYLTYTDVIKTRDDDDEEDVPKEYLVKLNPRKHASVNFRFEIDNVLSGKIYSPSSELMNSVCVRLYAPSGIDSKFPYLADCTEVGGVFRITEVPPGTYVLVANADNKISSDEPFPTLYYPGVTDLAKATTITVGLGDSREDLNIFVPRAAELVTITGKFLYLDKRPVVDEYVYFFSRANQSKHDADSRAKTDEEGRFDLKILKGVSGRIAGSMYTYAGEFENCPKLEAMIKATGKTFFEPQTNEFSVDGEGNLFDLELKFPFPSCKKAK